MKKAITVLVLSFLMVTAVAFAAPPGPVNLVGTWNMEMKSVHANGTNGVVDSTQPAVYDTSDATLVVRYQDQGSNLFDGHILLGSETIYVYGVIQGNNIFMSSEDTVITGVLAKGGVVFNFVAHNTSLGPPTGLLVRPATYIGVATKQ